MHLEGTVRVNIRTAVNNKTIRHEKRGGRDVIIVPSATLPDDVIMNNIKYPADEIAKSYMTLNRTPAPLGHPQINGEFISAREPEAINSFWIGAHNENVRRENGRVFLDKVIDVEVASRTTAGKSLIDAINKGAPIHTSTGVFLEVEPSTDASYSYLAKNMMFDHDAILMGEEGAATPSQGVGLMVNSATQVPVINSMLDCYTDSVEWSVKNLVDSIESLEKAKRTQGLVEKILSFLGIKSEGKYDEASGLNNNHGEENHMSVTKEQFDALAEDVKSLKANAEDVAKTVEGAIAKAMAPLLQANEALVANAKAAEETERATLTTKVVANGLLEEADCKGLAINALRKLADKEPAGSAAALAKGQYKANASTDNFADYNPNAAIDAFAKGGN